MYFISILFISSLTLPFISSSTIVENVTVAPIRPVVETLSTKEDYIAYAKKLSIQRGIQPHEVIGTMKCESGFRPNAIGDNGTSYGLSQIHLPAHPHITKEQALDPKFAIDFMVDEFAQGNQWKWTCWRTQFSGNTE